ncbi:molybdopterin molybdenumtransferase MoeA [Helicobacter sp. MIT 00-7814]|uniref:molybdopterin molybdotransferase MoeA n=1 Tax=unclassified Helicobacter TaxID=2593540 RepID=UPI000E1E8C3B|nr:MULTISPECIES: molybdopterin molybdotransferase MoeA [unclassified Helicobacter]RDU52818.1 molybdopterin molybdenumtransferase MoeA [Helicobacter sp. MIT 99-10781]RDU53245.1 molybdopterin molybdenumtransferase MoeA [Helicobacter sp. MIT 00-7814]
MIELAEIFQRLWESCAFKRDFLRGQVLQKGIFEAQGFVLAESLIASRALPAFSNSAMDGYAVLLEDSGCEVELLGRTLAGEKPQDALLQKGFVQKVMTGSPLPPNTQAIVPLELVENLPNGKIKLPNEIKPNQHIRLQGEEIALDSVVLPAFRRLKPLDLGLVATQGLEKVNVCKKPKIALFSTGDEVIEPGQSAQAHQIYNTNAISIFSILREFHHDIEYRGILPDKREVLEQTLGSLKSCDVVITTGGASVGDADMLKSTLQKLGAQILFDGVCLKPGRHLSVAILGECIFILLPGNPLASLLHLYAIIVSFLEFLSGANDCFLKAHSVRANVACIPTSGAQNLLLGIENDGVFEIFKNGKFGSSALINVWKNNALAIIDKDYGKIEALEELFCVRFGAQEFEAQCKFINSKRSGK